MKNRIKKTRILLQQNNLDALIIYGIWNRNYLSGIALEELSSENQYIFFLLTIENFFIFVDKRCLTEIKNNVTFYEVIKNKSDFLNKIVSYIRVLKLKKIGFETSYVSHLTFSELSNKILKIYNKASLIPIKGLVESVRKIKTEYELDKMKEAVLLAENAFHKLLSVIRLGMTEREVAWIFEKIIKDLGADDISFPIIVASGPNSSKPHAKVSNRKLKPNEPIIFDWGIRLGSYCSDTTRTVVFGNLSNKFEHVYITVLTALKRAISEIKSGVKTSFVDAIARNYINSSGYSGKFIHGLGHGIGIEVHEPPFISKLAEDTFQENMIVTIEPGIYLQNYGGVRIESQIQVCKDFCKILNKNNPEFYKLDIK